MNNNEIDIALIDLIAGKGRTSENLIPALQAIQAKYHYLPEQALRRLSDITGITYSSIMGVASFYDQFRLKPAGKHIIAVCHGTACHIKGAELVTDSFRRYLGIKPKEDTDKEGLFTVEKAACFGCCTLAPVVKIDDVTYGHVAPADIPSVIASFMQSADEKNKGIKTHEKMFLPKELKKIEVTVGLGSCCVAGGSMKVKECVEDLIKDTGVIAEIKRVGCTGMCHRTPLITFVDKDDKKVAYGNVHPDTVRKIADQYIKARGLSKIKKGANKLVDIIFNDVITESPGEYLVSDREIDGFFSKQKRIVLEGSGEMDPLSIDDYYDKDGFTALEKALKMKPAEVISEIKKSGLRGRGGAGFPTGQKWEIVKKQEEEKYLICNGDEGDPGAFMDRMLLESYPYRVIEGMLIAGFATGAKEGVFYIRREYPLAVTNILLALQRVKDAGYLGENIVKSGFNFDIKVFEGAGAFVCGEESALIASIEGKRGMPHIRPPYPAESGLYGKPTNVNNVETYATVPWIIKNGSAEFSKMGTKTSKGTKVFALAGKVKLGGLIEVPMGISIREIVEEIGGGVKEGRIFKAVQIGGPSGGCIPSGLSNLKIDFEELKEAGAIMGSGGLVVMDDTDCMVDIAKYFLEFTQNQSCGRCTFCRIGTKRMLEMLEKFTTGKAKKEDIDRLQKLAEEVRKNSLCGLGKTAPNPVLTTLHYYREEYEAHVEGRCPAKKCKALIRYTVNDKCIGCTLCSQNCPADAVSGKAYEKHKVDNEKCIKCGTCKTVCKSDAIDIES